MALKLITPGTVEELFAFIETLSFSSSPNNLVFRGHGSSTWRLESTLVRHVRDGFTELAITNMDETLKRFFDHLASVGKLPEQFQAWKRREKLEFARHHGLPSPLIDFSRSPYVALWMAINGKRPWTSGEAVVYALDVDGLGILWQKHSGHLDALDQFRYSERSALFDPVYQINMLQFISLPASWNTRMLRQMGTFIYDSLQYNRDVKFTDLEEFIEKGVDPSGPDGDNFTLHKIIVPYRFAKDVLRRLEPMGINGTRLFDNHEGAVADVINSYVWGGVTGASHDLR